MLVLSVVKGICEILCVDWYGNICFIFFCDRIFVFMGSEFVEVVLGVCVEDDSNGVKVV